VPHTARSTGIKQSIVSGHISSLPTKHIPILLSEHKDIYYESKVSVRSLKIFKKGGEDWGKAPYRGVGKLV
jgi:hypothetical protein